MTGHCDEGYVASGSVTIGDMLIKRINVKKAVGKGLCFYYVF
jgi:hypothetical protein